MESSSSVCFRAYRDVVALDFDTTGEALILVDSGTQRIERMYCRWHSKGGLVKSDLDGAEGLAVDWGWAGRLTRALNRFHLLYLRML